MTPKQADKVIKEGKPIMVTSWLDQEPFEVFIVSRDRWNVHTKDGGVFDRGDMNIVETQRKLR